MSPKQTLSFFIRLLAVKPPVSLLSQLADGLGWCFSGFLLCAPRRLLLRQMQSFPADVLKGRAREVVNQRVQHTVEIRQTNGDVENDSDVLHGGTVLDSQDHLDPDEQEGYVARQEADDEQHHHHDDEVQSLLELGLLGQLSLPQVANDVERAVENHEQRHVKGEEECELVPGQVTPGLCVNHEALAVGGVDVLQSEDVHRHGDGEHPQSECSQHGFTCTQRVDGVVGMHHAHVPVHGNGHQEEGAPAAIHGQHEEAEVTEPDAERPPNLRQVVDGTEWQTQDEHEICHGQVEEEHRAALPRPQVEAEDEQSQPVSKEAQEELHHQHRRERPDQHRAAEVAQHVELFCSFAVCRSKSHCEGCQSTLIRNHNSGGGKSEVRRLCFTGNHTFAFNC